MAQIAKLFADLTRAEQNRVLKWAEMRYIHGPLEDVDVDWFSKFTESAVAAAREMGDIKPIDLIKALAATREAVEPTAEDADT